MTASELKPVGLPKRNGARPKTIVGPLHLQYSGHGDSKYLHQLIKDVLAWPHLDLTAFSDDPPNVVGFRLEEKFISDESAAFLSPREFARVHLSAPTLVLALPLIWAHWAIVGGWAEPHYLRSFGLMPAGAVVVYTPRDAAEQAISYLLFSKAYHFASKAVSEMAGADRPASEC
jgi:hypothetical protein